MSLFSKKKVEYPFKASVDHCSWFIAQSHLIIEGGLIVLHFNQTTDTAFQEVQLLANQVA